MKTLLAVTLLAASSVAMAQSNITSGTNSNAAQTSTIQNTVNMPGGGDSNVHYDGSYTMKSVPTVYAPGLTASVTETCWGSVSAAVSAVGFGITGGATVKDLDCNRRLNAAVAWRMDRKDVAFNLMCQDADFRAAAADTDKPCREPKGAPVVAAQPVVGEPADPFVRARMGLPPVASK